MVPATARTDLEPPPRIRVVLLGASNLTRAISTVVQTLRQTLAGPLEIVAALGHGRSYGAVSCVCGRALPSIIDCGLWAALESGPPAPTFALITDVGNDIAYGHDVTRLAGWVEACLDRLEGHRARVVLTRPPLQSIRRLGPTRFKVARMVLFPGQSIGLEDAKHRVRELDEQLQQLGRRRDCTLVEPSPEWYGIDPIHIRMRCWTTAWGSILRAWARDPGEVRPARPGPRRWLILRSARPAEATFLGRAIGMRQPARTLADGTTVSLY
ncbi:MAG: SGNH/GDSL hydrolase family protein [Planctomycetota bacterium]|jgi:hypothetical protein